MPGIIYHIILLFFFGNYLLTVQYCHAQITFQKTFGGNSTDVGNSVKQIIDGGYIITGYTMSFGAGSWDIYMIRTNSAGDTLWTKTLGSLGQDWSGSIQQTSDSGYIVVGTMEGTFYLVKFDSVGDTLWTKSYSAAFADQSFWAYGVQQTFDGGYIMAGASIAGFWGSPKLSLIKLNNSGNVIWSKYYNPGLIDVGDGVLPDEMLQKTTDGGYLFAGAWWEYDVYLIKTNASGDTLWTKVYGGINNDHPRSILQSSDGGYVIAGITNSFGAGNYDVYLLKTDSAGNLLWTKTYGSIGNDLASSIYQTTDDGFIIAGATNSFGTGNYDVLLIKTDNTGNISWTKTFGGAGDDQSYSIQQTTDGGYIITGKTTSFGAGSYDVYLIKTDSLGNVGCNIASSTATITTNAATVVGSTNITVQSGVDVQYHTTFVNNAFTIVTDISVTNPVVDLGNDTSICDTCSITLDAGTEFISYSWYTGENTQTITVDSAGTYIVQVIDSNECSDSDSIIISLLPTSVNEEKNSLRSVYVLPNPSDGTFTIINQTLLNGEFWSITLHDILGRLIYEKENISNSQFTIDISDQPKGMYFVKSNTHTQYKNALVRKIILR